MSDREKMDYFFTELELLLTEGYSPKRAIEECVARYQYVFDLNPTAQNTKEQKHGNRTDSTGD